MHLNFDEIFKYTVFLLKKNGGYPYIPRDFKWIVQTILFFGLLTVVQLSLMRSCVLFEIKTDIIQACGSAILITMYFSVCLMYYVVIKHESSMRYVFEKMKEDYETANNSLPPDEKVIVEEYALKGQLAANVWAILAGCVSFSYLLRSLVAMSYLALMSDFHLVEFYPVTYINSVEKFKETLLGFWIIYFSWVWMAVYMGSFYMSVVPLAPVFMIHSCGQLEILKKRVMQLFSEDTKTVDEREKKLKIIIVELQNIYQFVNEIQTIFIFFYEIVLNATRIILPSVLYVIKHAIVNREFKTELLTTFIATLVIPGLQCYYGDMLIETGDEFKDTLYMSNWESHWDKRSRITLILMMTRAQHPISVRGVFRQINRDTLADVFRTSYTLFNFMIAAWG